MIRKLKLLLFLVGFLAILVGANWVIQVYRNPAILVSLFSGDRYKSSHTTWEVYGDLFEEHATETMTPIFLAALAQVESAGNPLVIPQWRWNWTTDLTRIYTPASTSAGLYQYTKSTFIDAKRFCIHRHQATLKKDFPDLSGCWFNFLYSRFWPSHAIEMTSARLDYYVSNIINQTNRQHSSLEDRHKLASIIHLCGVGNGRKFARNRFDFKTIPSCGSHSTMNYYSRIKRAMNQFEAVPKSFLDRIF